VRVAVLTVDQRDSRGQEDLVPAMLSALSVIPSLLAFERTAGDEIQGVLVEPESVRRVLETFIRSGAWNVGIGIGELETPLPESTRAGRGPAYLSARSAVTSAKSSPWHLRVVGDEGYRCRQLETVLWLWSAVLSRRTARGWEVADLVDEGVSYDDAGRRLGITQSAVSQRAQAAGLVEGRRARELTEQLAAELIGGG
jgi:hypothetical protein